MPQRIELSELQSGRIGGATIVVAHARAGKLVAFLATVDGDGIVDSRQDCLDAAQCFRALDDRATLDAKRQARKDGRKQDIRRVGQFNERPTAVHTIADDDLRPSTILGPPADIAAPEPNDQSRDA